MPPIRLPRRYQSGSTTQFSAKQPSTITPAVTAAESMKTRNRRLDRAISYRAFSELEIQKFADMTEAEDGDRGQHPDQRRTRDIGLPFEERRQHRYPGEERQIALPLGHAVVEGRMPAGEQLLGVRREPYEQDPEDQPWHHGELLERDRVAVEPNAGPSECLPDLTEPIVPRHRQI